MFLHLPKSGHPVTISPIECSCHVVDNPAEKLDSYLRAGMEQSDGKLELFVQWLVESESYLRNIPCLDTALAASVNIFSRIGNGDGANDLTMR